MGDRTWLLLATLAVGLFGFIFYMHTIQVTEAFALPEFFWLSLVLVSTSLIFLRSVKDQKIFLLALYFTSVFLGFWLWLRFGVRFISPDILSEIATAEVVGKSGWTSELIAKNRFGDSLSVTILPTMISRLLNLDLLPVFLFIFPIVLALTPILLYMVFNETFGFEVASLSCLIYLFDYVALTMNPILIRDSFGKFFFCCALLCLIRSTRQKSKRYVIPFMILLFATTSAAHTSSYFLMGFVLSLFFLPHKFLKRLPIFGHNIQRDAIVSSSLLLGTIVLIFTWMSFVGYLVLDEALKYGLMKTLQQLTYPRYHPFSEYIFSFPRGNYISNILTTIYRLAIIIGFFYALRISKNTWTSNFTIIGGLLLVILLAWLFFPGLARNTMHPDRVYNYGLIIFSLFIALIISKSAQILEKVGKVKSSIFKKLLISAIVSSFFLNNVFVMPFLYYMPSSSIPVEETIIYPFSGEAELSTKQWRENHIPRNITCYGDDKHSNVNILVWMDVQWINQTNYPLNILTIPFKKPPSLVFDKKMSCLLVTRYMTNYGYFVYSYFYHPEKIELPNEARIRYNIPSNVVVEIDRKIVNDFVNKLNVVYDNGIYSFCLS